MDKRSDRAGAYFVSGYNCAQAVAASFADLTGFDEKTVLRMASSFGGGLGRLREVCGAVSGMALIAGLLYGNTDPEDDTAKAAHYALVQQLALDFKQTHGTLICRELLEDAQTTPQPDTRTPQYYESRPCLELVKSAAQILDTLIQSRI